MAAMASFICCISFLHQTTTPNYVSITIRSCISFLFYIKPQLRWGSKGSDIVVYLFFSTSNHNSAFMQVKSVLVVYLFFSTSNHNNSDANISRRIVVYLFFSTSNHNYGVSMFLQVFVVYLFFSTSNHNTGSMVY